MISKRHVLAAVAWAAMASAAQADPSVSIVRNLAGPVAATSVTAFGSPEVLSGTLATAFFNDGSSEQAAFAVLGDTNANAIGTRFVIGAELGSDTNQPGNLFITNLDTSATLVGFMLDGRGAGSGTAGFDVSSFTSPNSTPGSNDGRELVMDFTLRSFITGLVTTTYSSPVSLDGAPAVGDLFAVVRVDLAYSNVGLNGGLLPNHPTLSSQKFNTDLDTVIYAAVPEPASALLLAVGGALLVGVRRRACRRPQPPCL
jgi:hypothetical protein